MLLPIASIALNLTKHNIFIKEYTSYDYSNVTGGVGPLFTESENTSGLA